jgi:hypothetical protein
MLDFAQASANGTLTFVLVKVNSSGKTQFATKENTTYDAPALTVSGLATELSVNPDSIAMDLGVLDSSVTSTVDVSLVASTNMDITVSISDTNSVGFSVLSAASQTLTNSPTALEFEFDNTVAGLSGETATGLVTIAWTDVPGGTSGQVLLPISVTVDPVSVAVNPESIAMDLALVDSSVTSMVDVSYVSSTNMDITVSISDTNSVGFSVLSAASQTLTNSPSALEFEFDNTVAGLSGETATGLVTIAWSEEGGGASGSVLVPISVTVEPASLTVNPEEIAMNLAFADDSATATVDVSYASSTNMDITITISDTNSVGFSVLSATPQTLTSSPAALEFEFDNTVAGVSGETVTGLVTIAWSEEGGGASGSVLLPISATVRERPPEGTPVTPSDDAYVSNGGASSYTFGVDDPEILKVRRSTTSGRPVRNQKVIIEFDANLSDLSTSTGISLVLDLVSRDTENATTFNVYGVPLIPIRWESIPVLRTASSMMRTIMVLM